MTKVAFRITALSVGAVIVLFVALQLIPVWALKTNPPVIAEPNWDSPETRALAQRACFDCHSNETVWPWHSHVAPISWLVVIGAVRRRNAMNFSEWGVREAGVDDVGEVIQNGQMPPSNYLLTHPDARLTDTEKQQLIDRLHKLLGAGMEGDEGGEHEGSEEGEGGSHGYPPSFTHVLPD